MTYIKSDNPICDYLELHVQDATISGSQLSWNIPNVYYSNLNSPVCEVSVAQASIDNVNNVNTNLKWRGSVQNGFNTRNSGLIFGHLIRNFDGGALSKYYLNDPSTVKILTTARPQTIILELVEPSDAGIVIDTNAGAGGFFVLKFQYYDYKAVTDGLINSSYPI